MKVIKALSLILFVGIIGWQVHSGMYDWSAVTTADVRQNWKSWVGSEVLLSNVSIRKYEIREQGADTFVALWLINGKTNPLDKEDTLLVLGRMPTEEAVKAESFASSLRAGANRLTSARVSIKDDVIVLRDYWLPGEASWFGAPYWLTINLVNRFASLGASVWTGVVVQALVYLVITVMVVGGLVLVIPSAE
ncbi:MAG TPA: hypothetical protein VFE33_13100 [Thermoanaerobaculia bacterium]|nr:hypothetical protein [Thermoanaerobaculia bacterium]